MIKISKAVSKKAFLKGGFYGESGSGKSFTALLIAEFLAKHDPQKRRILYIDTEGGTDFYAQDVPKRPVHPKAFDFDRPEEPTREVMTVRDLLRDPAIAEQYCVVVLDSMTHFWESAKASYSGPMTSIGQPPIQAWGPIKKPYKQMLESGLNGQYHFIINGRLRIEFEEDVESGKLNATGTSMKAEGETPYEPDLLIHMYQQRATKSATGLTPYEIKAYVEKDRTGVLSGRTFTNPKGEDFEPLLSVLTASSHGGVQTIEQAAERDASQIVEDEEQKERVRFETFQTIRKAMEAAGANSNGDMAEATRQLKVAWDMTKGKKMILGAENFEQLEKIKENRKAELTKLVGV